MAERASGIDGLPAADEMALFRNPAFSREEDAAPREVAILDAVEARTAVNEIVSWPGYAPTPLLSLPGLARRGAVASIHLKDESGRFGLGSFKALGGAYAVYRYLAARVNERSPESQVTSARMARGAYAEFIADETVCCATDGNHGRSVAWGAQVFGCACVIYLHEHVSAGRERAIARCGARIVRTPGNYDDSVRRAAGEAEARGWAVISDTSWEGYTRIPRDVMHGYTLMAAEVLDTLTPENRPTHVFIQGGVGGVAAAVCAYFAWASTQRRPHFVVVEPARAACLYESARAGRAVALGGALDTVMACLAAGEVSLLAWRELERGVEWFMTLPEAAAAHAMRLLARGEDGNPRIVAGESGAAGLAGFLYVANDARSRAALGLDSESRVLVFNTEGATDPEIYQRIVGHAPDGVMV